MTVPIVARMHAEALLGDHANAIADANYQHYAQRALDELGLTHEQRFIIDHIIRVTQYSAMTVAYRIGAGKTIDPRRRQN